MRRVACVSYATGRLLSQPQSRHRKGHINALNSRYYSLVAHVSSTEETDATDEINSILVYVCDAVRSRAQAQDPGDEDPLAGHARPISTPDRWTSRGRATETAKTVKARIMIRIMTAMKYHRSLTAWSAGLCRVGSPTVATTLALGHREELMCVSHPRNTSQTSPRSNLGSCRPRFTRSRLCLDQLRPACRADPGYGHHESHWQPLRLCE